MSETCAYSLNEYIMFINASVCDSRLLSHFDNLCVVAIVWVCASVISREMCSGKVRRYGIVLLVMSPCSLARIFSFCSC